MIATVVVVVVEVVKTDVPIEVADMTEVRTEVIVTVGEYVVVGMNDVLSCVTMTVG